MNRLASLRQRLPGYALGGDVWDGGSSYGGTGTGSSSANNGGALAGNAADMTNQASGSGYNLGLAGAAPSVTALAGLAGVDASAARTGFGAATSALGPVGMGLSAANMAANAYNGYGNYGALAAIGTPMSFGQALGSLMGNAYSGTTAQALGAMGNQLGPNTTGPNIGGPNPADIAAAQLAGPTETAPRVDVAQTDLAAPAPAPAAPEVAAASAQSSDAGGGGSQSGGGDNGAGQGGNGAEQGGGAFAVGGLVTQGVTDRSTRALRHVSGLVAGHSPGTADTIAATVPENSYVIPADVVAAMGGGNTLAGAATLDKSRAAHSTAPGPSQDHAMLDIRLSAGEYLIRADHVASIGNGNLARGHQALDTIVRGVRTNAIQHLQEKLAGGTAQAAA